jgi:hypothetical protein
VINDLEALPFIMDYNIKNPDTPDKYVKSIKRIKKTLNYSGLSIAHYSMGLFNPSGTGDHSRYYKPRLS